MLDQYVDQASVAGAPRVTVIHGHGSGALRDALRAQLSWPPAGQVVAPRRTWRRRRRRDDRRALGRGHEPRLADVSLRSQRWPEADCGRELSLGRLRGRGRRRRFLDRRGRGGLRTGVGVGVSGPAWASESRDGVGVGVSGGGVMHDGRDGAGAERRQHRRRRRGHRQAGFGRRERRAPRPPVRREVAIEDVARPSRRLGRSAGRVRPACLGAVDPVEVGCLPVGWPGSTPSSARKPCVSGVPKQPSTHSNQRFGSFSRASAGAFGFGMTCMPTLVVSAREPCPR